MRVERSMTTFDATRRKFLWTVGVAGMSLPILATGGESRPLTRERLRVLSIGVCGTIGGMDRKIVASHPLVDVVGLCDVDDKALAVAKKDHPGAFVCKDYREAFSTHGEKFDAVIVATPDHTHAPIMLTALAHGKHVYGQKPLVHQLEELGMMERAIASKPELCTQLGNQRMATQGRRAAVDILRSGVLGKAVEAHVWVESPNSRDYFNLDRKVEAPAPVPEGLDWDLWLGPCPKVDYRPGIAPVFWRSWWDYGSNGLGDWGCHVLDVIFLAYQELVSPVSVQTHCVKTPNEWFHTHPCRSTLTYRVSGQRFAKKEFVIRYSDSGQAVSRASLGLPPGRFEDQNMTVVVCEGGVLVLGAAGRLEVWRDGKMEVGTKMPGLPEYRKIEHRHAWVDQCLGKAAEVWTPFRDALRMTEATLLAVKASRYPGQELWWDKKGLAFQGHADASAKIVRREYRQGFAPPA